MKHLLLLLMMAGCSHVTVNVNGAGTLKDIGVSIESTKEPSPSDDINKGESK